MKIAWIGTGVMGAPMALHLAKAGHQVTVYNRSPEKARALVPFVKVAPSIEEAVKEADVVFTIVGFPSDVEAVYNALYEVVTPSTILIDMTTSSPVLAKSIATQFSTKSISVLDAPVTGGDVGARNATLSIMVGGSKTSYEIALPLLQKLGTRITYMGESGAGQYAKLTNQIAIAGAIAGVAEALTFSNYHGLDGEHMLSVITGGSAQSWQAINNGPKMLNHDRKPGFYVKHFLKDLNLALEMCGQMKLPVLSSVAAIYAKLSELGKTEEGTQVIYDYYQLFK